MELQFFFLREVEKKKTVFFLRLLSMEDKEEKVSFFNGRSIIQELKTIDRKRTRIESDIKKLSKDKSSKGDRGSRKGGSKGEKV